MLYFRVRDDIICWNFSSVYLESISTNAYTQAYDYLKTMLLYPVLSSKRVDSHREPIRIPSCVTKTSLSAQMGSMKLSLTCIATQQVLGREPRGSSCDGFVLGKYSRAAVHDFHLPTLCRVGANNTRQDKTRLIQVCSKNLLLYYTVRKFSMQISY